MTDYPSIDPADVREGDVVRGTVADGDWKDSVIEGKATDYTGDGDLWVAAWALFRLTDLRLISRPTPPEPPLRVGDFMRWAMYDIETQMVTESMASYYDRAGGVRIEPPVGWPVVVPDDDAPGGVRWYTRLRDGGRYLPYVDRGTTGLTWADLLAAGGVPAVRP